MYFSDCTDNGSTLFIEILLFACTFSLSMILKNVLIILSAKCFYSIKSLEQTRTLYESH